MSRRRLWSAGSSTRGPTDVDGQGERLRAIEEIAAIARHHGISSNEIAVVLGETHEASESRWRGVLVRVLGFLGGTFVFAGIGIFIALQWDSLNSASRVVVTFGSGTSAFALAVLASRDARFGTIVCCGGRWMLGGWER